MPTTLILDLLPYAVSTRSQRVCSTARTVGDVDYVALSTAGRFGIEVPAGEVREGSLQLCHVRNRRLSTNRSAVATLQNVVWSYLPGLARLSYRAVRTPASVVIVSDPALLPVGLLHRWRWGSRLVFAARERPGSVRTKGSLATYVAYVERPVLRAVSGQIDLCVAACESHGEEFRRMGCAPVIVCRNVPNRPQVRPGVSQRHGTLALVYVGSLYPGRGLEVLIESIAVCSELGVEVSVEISGWGDQGYIATLQRAAKARGVAHLVQFLGPCSAEEVPGRYSRGTVACVFYEAVDDANDSLPSKLFEALAAGRVILASDLAEVNAAVATFQCGVTTPLTPPALADALMYLSGLKPAEIASMADNSWRAATEQLNWEAEEQDLYSWLSDNAARQRGVGRKRLW